MELKRVRLNQIRKYPGNPRRNQEAVEAVAESIRQCGYCAPILVDEEMVILAGHTRLLALQRLGFRDCEIVVRPGLTEEQKRKYRILDNKTGELADWDPERLRLELQELDFGGFDFGLDLGELALEPKPDGSGFRVLCDLGSRQEAETVEEHLKELGYTCRIQKRRG